VRQARRIGPPLNTTEEHIDLGIEALRGALDELARIGAPAASAV
jgi:4-aminobutyrate aminotransferase-like enzyme